MSLLLLLHGARAVLPAPPPAPPRTPPGGAGGAFWSVGNRPGLGWHDYRLPWTERHHEFSDTLAALSADGTIDTDVWAALLAFEEQE